MKYIIVLLFIGGLFLLSCNSGGTKCECSLLTDYVKLNSAFWKTSSDSLASISIEGSLEKNKGRLLIPYSYLGKQGTSYHVTDDDFQQVILVMCQYYYSWSDPKTCAIKEDKIHEFGERLGKELNKKPLQTLIDVPRLIQTKSDSLKKLPISPENNWKVNHLHRLLDEYSRMPNPNQKLQDSFINVAQKYF